MGQYQTFIVRIWTDGTASAARGHIQHIASRRGKYFQDEAKLMQFIREFVDTSMLPVVDNGDNANYPAGASTSPLVETVDEQGSDEA